MTLFVSDASEVHSVLRFTPSNGTWIGSVVYDRQTMLHAAAVAAAAVAVAAAADAAAAVAAAAAAADSAVDSMIGV